MKNNYENNSQRGLPLVKTLMLFTGLALLMFTSSCREKQSEYKLIKPTIADIQNAINNASSYSNIDPPAWYQEQEVKDVQKELVNVIFSQTEQHLSYKSKHDGQEFEIFAPDDYELPKQETLDRVEEVIHETICPNNPGLCNKTHESTFFVADWGPPDSETFDVSRTYLSPTSSNTTSIVNLNGEYIEKSQTDQLMVEWGQAHSNRVITNYPGTWQEMEWNQFGSASYAAQQNMDYTEYENYARNTFNSPSGEVTTVAYSEKMYYETFCGYIYENPCDGNAAKLQNLPATNNQK